MPPALAGALAGGRSAETDVKHSTKAVAEIPPKTNGRSAEADSGSLK
jgi:hypothetical protein